MKEKTEEKSGDIFGKITEQVDKKLEALTKEGVQQNNVDYVGKLIDIKKDISKMNYLESEENNMMYRGYDNYGNYDNYGGGRSRDSRGRFMEGNRGNYGRRYRGHDMIDNMSEYYGTYMDGIENGRYSGPETSKALDYMLQSVEEFMMTLKNDANSQEEVDKIRRTAKRISDM